MVPFCSPGLFSCRILEEPTPSNVAFAAVSVKYGWRDCCGLSQGKGLETDLVEEGPNKMIQTQQYDLHCMSADRYHHPK